MRVLVTGASGFVGSLLAARLRAEGYVVRALVRDPERARFALARARGTLRGGQREAPVTAGLHDARARRPRVEVVRGDVVSADGLARALDGVEVAYYLIHSMERAPARARSFPERDRIAAENFAAAASRAGVRRIVYLGGLVERAAEPEIGSGRDAPASSSRHLASREQVERILLDAVADSLALRASIVIGARSRSFRLLVHLVERMPVLALPSWHSLRTQPIDERDVIAMLAACATTTRVSARSLDIGGPDVLMYGEMLQSIAEVMLVNRPTLKLGVRLTGVTARVAAAIAGEDPELVSALMEGLQGDLLPAHDRAHELLGVRLHTFDSAVEHALSQWEAFEPLAAR
jgi:uncharacterized protein YbjT (DUF2867 family)